MGEIKENDLNSTASRWIERVSPERIKELQQAKSNETIILTK
jgi:hypothetical protein